MTDDLKVTSGGAWRQPREEGFVKRLLSGRVARLRPVQMDVLLAEGKIPDLLTGYAVGQIMEPSEEDPLDNEKLRKNTTEMIELMNVVCKAAFVEPKIVDEPQADNEITIEDIELQDRSMVWRLATQPVEALRKFRLGEGPGVEDVHDGGDDGTEAEPDTESDE